VQGPIARVQNAEPADSATEPTADSSAESTGNAAGSDAGSTAAGNGAQKRPAMIQLAKAKAGDGSSMPVSVPERADGSLRLVSPRRLYDHGVQMLESEFLAGMVEKLVAKVNPSELSSREISSGSSVRLRSGASSLEIEVVGDSGVLPGVVEVSANIRPSRGDDESAARLTSIEDVVTELQLERA
jgi:hypothetical protein